MIFIHRADYICCWPGMLIMMGGEYQASGLIKVMPAALNAVIGVRAACHAMLTFGNTCQRSQVCLASVPRRRRSPLGLPAPVQPCS